MSTKPIPIDQVTVSVTLSRTDYERWRNAAGAHEQSRRNDGEDPRTVAETIPGWIEDICDAAAYDVPEPDKPADAKWSAATAAYMRRTFKAPSSRAKPNKTKASKNKSKSKTSTRRKR